MDTLILYSYGLNQTLKAIQQTNKSVSLLDMDLRLGKEIASNLRNFEFGGYSGNVKIDKRGVRVSYLQFSGLDSNFTRALYFTSIANSTSSILIKNFTNDSIVWASRGGIRPLSTPKCGFDGSQCLPSFWSSYATLIYSAMAFLLILIALTVLFLVR